MWKQPCCPSASFPHCGWGLARTGHVSSSLGHVTYLLLQEEGSGSHGRKGVWLLRLCQTGEKEEGLRWVEGKCQGHRQVLVILTLVMAAQGVARPHLASFALGTQSKQQRRKLS